MFIYVYSTIYSILLYRILLRFVGGIYSIVDGGFSEGVAHLLSGGIYDNYKRDAATKKQPEQPDDSELFVIIEHAFKLNNLMSCYHLKETNVNGIFRKHAFTITDVRNINNIRIVKIQDPHNDPNREIKKLELFLNRIVTYYNLNALIASLIVNRITTVSCVLTV